jgi:hypothetical protein
MPNISPAVSDTIKNARKGFTFAQLTNKTSRIMQKRITSSTMDVPL